MYQILGFFHIRLVQRMVAHTTDIRANMSEYLVKTNGHGDKINETIL